MLKDCGATEEQLEKFEHDFYIVAKKYLFGAKKKSWNLKDRLQFSKRSVYNLLRKVIGIESPIALSIKINL